jgi:hypothetical protein
MPTNQLIAAAKRCINTGAHSTATTNRTITVQTGSVSYAAVSL